MRCSIMIEPDGRRSYPVARNLALHAEALGFSGFYVSDHYEPAFDWFKDGAPDSWTLLAGLAVETADIALGTMVTPVTLRRVSTLAKVICTVSWMTASDDGSIGRVHVGLGAGWLEAEHDHLGLAFGGPRERFDRLAEHLEVLHRLWDPDEQRTTVIGEHVIVRDAPFTPAPRRPPHIILGGRGRVRLPRLAARYADEVNVPFMPIDELKGYRGLLANACREIDRDPATLGFSAKRGVLTGRSVDEMRARADRMRMLAGDERSVDDYLSWLSERWLVGTGPQIGAQAADLAAVGVEHLVLQHLLPDDLDMVDVLADCIDMERGNGKSTPGKGAQGGREDQADVGS